MTKRILGVCVVALAASAPASAQFLLDGNMDSLAIGTAPDNNTPAGAWGFPASYVSGAAAETDPNQMTIVATSSFQPFALGNSLRLNFNDPTGLTNVHLPNLFTQPITDNATVSFDLWITGPAGGSVYVGQNGFNNGTDRGPQITFLPNQTMVWTMVGGVNTVAVPAYSFNTWQHVRMEIDVNTDRYDLYWSEGAAAPALVGDDLTFRSGSLTALDRFTFVAFGGTTPIADSYLDNVSVVPAPGVLALAGAGLVLAGRRRRS